MQKRRIGSLEVSLVGLGCNNFGWRIGVSDTAAVVNAALEAGINFFDTADFYGTGQSEEYLGHALGARRKDVLVATKFGLPMGEGREGGSPAYIKQAVEASLSRLGTDYIDLYQLHRPDPKTPIADTLGALSELVTAGKVREIGCSNFTAAMIEEAEKAGKPGMARFASVQNHYSMITREPELHVLPECERRGLAFLPYFPLENGLLTGKYHAGQPLPEGSRAKDEWGPKIFTPENLMRAESLGQFARQHGHSLLELAFGYLAAQDSVSSIIAGAKNAEQIKANSAALGWTLTGSELNEVRALLA